jgi:glyoxylase-like metal-dependent hydrolase (beta-lactamase superfamily II)
LDFEVINDLYSLRKSLMQITNNLHAFIWQSMTANNCNAYFIDGPIRILIDPGHRALFDHVDLGLKELGLKTDDIDLVICTHAHPDHLEAVPLFKNKGAQFTLHEIEWQWAATVGRQMSASFGIDIDTFAPDFFLQEGELSLDGLEMNVFHTPGLVATEAFTIQSIASDHLLVAVDLELSRG